MAVRFGRRAANDWEREEFRQPWAERKFNPNNGRIMFPSTHDITPSNLQQCLQFLSRILAEGNEVLIVTKPQSSCIKAICDSFLKHRKQIMFRFTIGSTNDQVLSFWEPGAPRFTERLLSVQYAYFNGFKTSISCEPMLDAHPERIASIFLPYVTDAIWFGKPNFLTRRLARNGYGDKAHIQAGINLIKIFSDDFIAQLYQRFEDNNRIKWKESIKKVLDLAVPLEVGLDI